MSLPSTIMNVQLEAPVRFSPSVERPDADEAKTTQGLIATMRYINEKTFADGGHALRSVHAKTHGILQGYLEVDTDLPDDLAQGLFAKPGRYPVVMRFSTLPGDVLDDSVSTPRGLAIKVIGVEGDAGQIVEGAVAAGVSRAHTKVFASSEDAAKFLADFVAPGDLLLVKGSRGVKMERIVEGLLAVHAPGLENAEKVRH